MSHKCNRYIVRQYIPIGSVFIVSFTFIATWIYTPFIQNTFKLSVYKVHVDEQMCGVCQQRNIFLVEICLLQLQSVRDNRTSIVINEPYKNATFSFFSHFCKHEHDRGRFWAIQAFYYEKKNRWQHDWCLTILVAIYGLDLTGYNAVASWWSG